MLCTACDTRNEATARFCRVCGTALAQPVAVNQPTTGQTVAFKTESASVNQQASCGSCGRANPAGARYCVYCAAPLSGTTFKGAGSPMVMQSVGGPTINIQPIAFVGSIPSGGIHLLIRAAWFLVIGLWLGLLWTLVAWLFNLTVIFLPLGLWMLNRTPQVMTLRPPAQPRVTVQHGAVLVQQGTRIPFLIRALWFFFIGWWASLLWLLLAWGLTATFIFLPIAFWMFDRVPTITTLAAEY